MARRFWRKSLMAVLPYVLLASSHLEAQNQVGLPPWNSFDSDSFSSINLSNLDIHIEIPLRSLPGRGLAVNTRLVSDTNILGSPGPLHGPGTQVGWPGTGVNYVTGTPVMGNFVARGLMPGHVFFTETTAYCPTSSGEQDPYSVYSNFYYIDGSGTLHYFPTQLQVAGLSQPLSGHPYECTSFSPDPGWGTNMLGGGATDSSPYMLYLSGGANAPGPPYVIDISDGVTNESVDANGNSNSFTGSTLTDSTGNVALSVTGTSSTTTFSYAGADGQAKNIIVTTTPFTGTGAVNCSGIANPSGYPIPRNLVSSIALPDGTSYSFTYEPILGRPQSITLPTGGIIRFSYNGANSGISCLDGGLNNLTKTTPDGTWQYTRSYDSTTRLWTTIVTDPQGNVSVYTFGSSGGEQYTAVPIPQYEIDRKQYLGNQQTLLKEVITCYNENFTNCATDIDPTATAATNNNIVAPFQKDIYTYLPNVPGPSLSEVTFMDSNRMTEDKEYDFGASLPPLSNFVRDHKISYQIYSCPASDITTNASGVTLSRTSYICDNYGHATTVKRWIQGSTYATTTTTYTSAGLLETTTDPLNTKTTYTYGFCDSSFPSLIEKVTTTGGDLSTSMAWDCSGEVPTSLTQNNNLTQYIYVDGGGAGDPFWRLRSTIYPDGGKVTTTYNDTASPPNYVTSVLLDKNGDTLSTQVNVDGLNRPVENITSGSGRVGSVEVDTSYDALGRVFAVSNPYTVGGSTTALTTYYYDPLGRKIEQVNQDRGKQWWCFENIKTGSQPNCHSQKASAERDWVDHADENLNDWQETLDGLGRTTAVFEPSGSSQTPSMETDYGYDGLGNLVSVTQKGLPGTDTARPTRSFNYDGLARLTSSYNPESGTTTYGYDLNGNLKSKTAPAPNAAPGSSSSITASYTYDGFNRVLSKSYSDVAKTPTSCYQYDTSSISGAGGNLSGHLTNEWTLPSATSCAAAPPSSGVQTIRSILSYDSMGRIWNEEQCTPAGCYESTACPREPLKYSPVHSPRG